ncbi:Acetylcholinesterase-1 [Araneus ventricosus]|uniref:Carboxylic ester hydrolase n=1 Tax=Araneus ventricosus TaxID=182803 RepID=A0A4Y2HQU3_ARAVE|nr:Acetylcholinesterase-1 [Araneus ventricosus]
MYRYEDATHETRCQKIPPHISRIEDRIETELDFPNRNMGVNIMMCVCARELGFIVGVEIASSLNTFVYTSLGPIQGTSENVHRVPVQAFLGIPYAEPPLGNQRFLKPKPVKPWTKTLEATKLPPACIQYTIYPFPWYDDLPGKSEDCLYLNIYAPSYAKTGSNLAVLFWIHGGGFVFGSSRMDVYDASALVLHGNVIVVTINYRLGVLGFLTSNTKDAPGNVGMYDMFTALQWVNQNIQSFGGDKERITLIGESAGSFSVSLFCVSPLTKGLFSGAIMESGSTIYLITNQLQSNMDLSQQVAEIVGCTSDDKTIESDPESVVGCLRNKNATSLARALWSLNPTATSFYWPQYGDDLFPSNTIDDIRNGNFHDVPLLIGNNRDEGSFFITTTDSKTFGFFGQKDTKINKTYADHVIRNFFEGYGNPEKYARYYLDSVTDDDYDAIRRQTYTAVGDNILLCPTVYFAESYAERKNEVYFYFFVHRPSNSIWAPWMGVAHFDEVQFVFGRPIRKPELYEPNEIELSKKMILAWTNFAKYEAPSYTFYWPKYSKDKHDLVYIDTVFRGDLYGSGPHLENCNFLRDHYGF